MDMYVDVYVSEAAISQTGAIWCCTLQTCNSTRAPSFRYLACVLQCAVFPRTPVHHTLRSLLLFLFIFS